MGLIRWHISEQFSRESFLKKIYIYTYAFMTHEIFTCRSSFLCLETQHQLDVYVMKVEKILTTGKKNGKWIFPNDSILTIITKHISRVLQKLCARLPSKLRLMCFLFQSHFKIKGFSSSHFQCFFSTALFFMVHEHISELIKADKNVYYDVSLSWNKMEIVFFLLHLS